MANSGENTQGFVKKELAKKSAQKMNTTLCSMANELKNLSDALKAMMTGSTLDGTKIPLWNGSSAKKFYEKAKKNVEEDLKDYEKAWNTANLLAIFAKSGKVLDGMTSNDITAKAPTAAKSAFAVTIPASVTDDAAVVIKGAHDQYVKIMNAYKNLNTHFQSLATELTNAAKNAVGSTKAPLTKRATACKKQGEYCLNKRTMLKNLYDRAQLNAKLADLERRLSLLEKS